MKCIFSTLILLVFFISSNAQTVTQVKTLGCIEGNCNEGTGKFLFSNGDKFNGEWHGGMRSGYGRYDFKNGNWYIGDFKNDIIEGKGVFHASNGKVISGEWFNYELVKVDKPEDSPSLHMKLPIMQNKK
ncbi:MAG: hypothetical protein WCI97_02545 [Bacteroidota bacterium]